MLQNILTNSSEIYLNTVNFKPIISLLIDRSPAIMKNDTNGMIVNILPSLHLNEAMGSRYQFISKGLEDRIKTDFGFSFDVISSDRLDVELSLKSGDFSNVAFQLKTVRPSKGLHSFYKEYPLQTDSPNYTYIYVNKFNPYKPEMDYYLSNSNYTTLQESELFNSNELLLKILDLPTTGELGNYSDELQILLESLSL